jgi:hypothetical protein
MNQSTWVSWITTGIGLFGAVAVDRGLVDSSTVAGIAGVAGTLVPLVWGLYIHSNSKVVQTASEIKGSDGQPAVKVLIAPTASQPLLDLATDTSVPEVVHAASVVPSAPPPKDYQAALRDRTKDPYETTRRTS